MDIAFTEQAYKEVYAKHVGNLKQFHVRSEDHGILPAILKKLDENGWYVTRNWLATLLTVACRLHAKVALDVKDHRTENLCNDAIDAAIQEFKECNGDQGKKDM